MPEVVVRARATRQPGAYTSPAVAIPAGTSFVEIVVDRESWPDDGKLHTLALEIDGGFGWERVAEAKLAGGVSIGRDGLESTSSRLRAEFKEPTPEGAQARLFFENQSRLTTTLRVAWG